MAQEEPLPPGQYRVGTLTEVEKFHIHQAVERARVDENLSEEEMNRIIHENPKFQPVDSPHYRLWVRVQQACPSRSKQKIINWCRLAFHNFVARGKWTKEQDDELLELVERHGKCWAKIAGLINRHHTDTRDRYRNDLIVRDTQVWDAWTKEEEECLYEAIQQAMIRIRDNTDNPAIEDVGRLINWHHISEAMGFTRSRLQCLGKWKD
ncbi:hypothetical protein B0H67DRAFT_480847, partial [Lasiosphaeris hirsuta]